MTDAKNPFSTRQETAPECQFCGASGVTVQLMQCRICHRRFCDECSYKGHKGRFCTEVCSRIFFEGGLEDEPDEFDEKKEYDD